MSPVCLLWLRQDLRLAENPALAAVLRAGLVPIPVYVHAPHEESPWAPGAASRVWLHESLLDLQRALRERGSSLVLRHGPALQALAALAHETGAVAVYWNRRYEPAVVARDAALERALREHGLEVRSFNGALLNEPGAIRNRQGGPFRVFTAYYRHCQALPAPDAPEPAPRTLPAPARWPAGEPLEALSLLPRVDWTGGIRAAWRMGEDAAHESLAVFLDDGLEHYAEGRDRPARSGVSRLSAHLHFGEIGPRTVWHAARAAGVERAGAFVRQLYWREFAHHLLASFPDTPHAPLNARFEGFAWRDDPHGLAAWQAGRTGYPLVDAGLRELWQTGWMHNRVRMNAASFLIKHLLVHWREGARWFWDTLVDADLANNTMGWQWVAGCGADAAPFFRIFNPSLQGQRFDPQGRYVARWVPELARLPERWIHEPWTAPAAVLREAGVRLGTDYPEPLVDHRAARARALETFKKL